MERELVIVSVSGLQALRSRWPSVHALRFRDSEFQVFKPREPTMALFRWGSPIDAFRDMEREMDRVLRSMNQAFEGLRIGRPYPPVNGS